MLTDEQLIRQIKAALNHETTGIDPPEDLLDSLRERLTLAPRTGRRRLRRPTVGVLVTALAAAVAVAVALVAVILVKHKQPTSPGRTIAVIPATPPGGARLPLGTPAGPGIASPNSFQGAAIPRTVKLVAETADPHGGLPWGLRAFQTTRGQTCLQVGRVQDGTIGVLGQDNAWADDHRFHPISPNAYTADSCSATDARGNSFNNVSTEGIASADVPWGDGRQAGQCRTGPGPGSAPVCPAADVRQLDYGLLGPDARAITYTNANGDHVNESTSGREGAYLIVQLATRPPCVQTQDGGLSCSSGGGRTSGAGLPSGVITAVSYRDGHVCRLPAPTSAGVQQASCPPVGYVAPQEQRITAAQVATAVTVRKLRAKQYCTSGPLALAPCTPGQAPLKGDQRTLLVEFSFTARIAVTKGNSYYEYTDTYPSAGRQGCTSSGSSGTTPANIRVGEHVAFQDQIPLACSGVVHGTVAYVPNAGAAGFGSGPSPTPGHDGSITVGQFSFATP